MSVLSDEATCRRAAIQQAQLFLCVLHAEFPAITVGIVEPEAHMGRAGPLWTDFISRIFQIDLNALQMFERLS
jgi:hypothetical protein